MKTAAWPVVALLSCAATSIAPPIRAEVEPPGTAWSGVASPVLLTVQVAGGVGLRNADSVYFGPGVGVAVAYAARNGLHLGLRYHRYFGRTVEAEVPGMPRESRSGSNHLFLLEGGKDFVLTPAFDLRAAIGVGLLTSAGHGTLRYPAPLPSVDLVSSDRTFVAEPMVALLARPTPHLYLGPQVGVLFSFGSPERVTLAATDVNLVVGAAF